jgi:hypothetical protein
MKCGYYRQRNFYDQKNRHDNYQHECGAILIVGSLRLLVAFVEKLLSFLLCQSHRPEQENVE